jgi:hypothetical protein
MAEVGRFRSEVVIGEQDRKSTMRFNASTAQRKMG